MIVDQYFRLSSKLSALLFKKILLIG